MIADHRVSAAELDAVLKPVPSSESPELTFSGPIPAPRTHDYRGTGPAGNQDWGALQEILAQLDDLAHRVIRLEETTGHRRPAHPRGGLGAWVPSGGHRDGFPIDRTRPEPLPPRTSDSNHRPHLMR